MWLLETRDSVFDRNTLEMALTIEADVQVFSLLLRVGTDKLIG